MKFFSNILVLVLSCCNLKTFAESSSQLEKCRKERVQDNENSSNSWRFSRMPEDEEGLTKANMMGQSLASINRATFESLDKPRTVILDLSINRISEIEMGAFASFRNLRILKIRINNLWRINSTTFEGLMMLEELDLSSNMISDFDDDAFRIMLNLHTIDLSENCIFQLPNYLLFRNHRLINIYLKHNHLDALPFLMPAQQFVLNLNITGNHFTNMTSLSSNFNNVQSLDLSDNPLSPEEMTNRVSDMVKENDSSSESDENYGYLNIRYAADAESTRKSRQLPQSDQIDFSPDVNFMASSRARTSSTTESFHFNENLDYLMDVFRPLRTSEEAIESLIKTIIEKKPEKFLVTDTIQVLSRIISFYRTQNRQRFRDEMNDMRRNNEQFDVASFVQFLRDLIKSNFNRTARDAERRYRYTPEQMEQLIRATRTNHLKKFTCRNCSLQSLTFLIKYPELKYVDVTGNRIKTVNEEQLGMALRNLQYLIASNNKIASLNFNVMLESWLDFRVLILNDNPLNCDLVAEIKYQAAHLNKMFKLEVSECK